MDELSCMKELRPPSTDINGRIARRVAALRAELGLTLDALAAKSEVSRSMISLVERGETSPTAVVLEKVATALGVPLASLFEDGAAPAAPLSRRAERTPWRDPSSGYVRCNISPPNFPSPIKIVEVELPAGARIAYEAGPGAPGFHQQIWVQEGAIEFSLGGVTHRLGAGDCLAMRLSGPAAFHNPARKRARYIVVVATTEHGRGPKKGRS